MHNKNLTIAARQLRKEMTPQEKKLWHKFLKDYPIRILRQKVIMRFIVDFYCKQASLVIEIDGGQHLSDEAMVKDKERTIMIENLGLKVIRFSNKDIENNINDVCESIDKEIKSRI